MSEIVDLADLAPAFPELVLAVGIVVLLLLGVLFLGARAALVNVLAIALLLVTLAVVALHPVDGTLFSGSFIVDGFARYMKLLVLAGAAAMLVLAGPVTKVYGLDKFEFSILALLATLGMMVMVSANDLMSLYIGLELQSLALYVLAAFRRDDGRASEAGLKYFVLGALSSGMLLYGASLVYGFTGLTQLDALAAMLAAADRSVGLIFGMVFVLVGVAFKISAVPFHMWTPDVYEGAPTPVTAFFAAAPKIAAMALFVRLVTVPFGSFTPDWQQVVMALSVASMVLAAFAAIGQNNLKRLLAYSSIGHVGFALVGLSAGTAVGVEGVAVYMAVYLLMTIGMFAAVLSLKTAQGPVETIDQLAGLWRGRPFLAVVIAVILFSLIGIPPLAGFFAKWQVFLAAIDAHLFVLAVIGVLASAVSAFYYLRITKVMFFDEPSVELAAPAPALAWVAGGAAVLIAVYYFTLGPAVYAAARYAAGSLF